MYKQYQIERTENRSEFDEIRFISGLYAYAIGTMVQAPRWVIYFSDRCRKMGYFAVAAAVLRLITNGKIAIGALQYVQTHQKDILSR